jgi:phosphopantothenoylcysteine decarboxylase
MSNVLVGATGSVAAIRVPELYRQLRLAGHAVKVVTTRAALYFFDPAALDPGAVVRDEDEWPGRDAGRLWQRDDPVLHIELRRWADLFAVAPLDANTLAKLANGLSDNCLTCVWRAWDAARPVVLAPAMNTLMWEHPLTGRHLRQIAADHGGGDVPAGLALDGVAAWVNGRCPRLRIVGPQSKRLACGDVGTGAMADVAEIVSEIGGLLAFQPLENR